LWSAFIFSIYSGQSFGRKRPNILTNGKNGSPLGQKMDEPWANVPVARAAPEAEGARERMEIRHTSFLLKNTLLL